MRKQSEEELIKAVYMLIDYLMDYPDSAGAHGQSRSLDMLNTIKYHVEENQEIEE